jgi:pyrroline-5-carboxylate reductase
MNKILLIGCGHMGLALLKSWLNTNNNFYIVDPKKYAQIQIEFKNNKVQVYKSINQIKNLGSIDIVIFAVRPQQSEKVLKEIKNIIFNKKTVFVSIIAGKKINFFNKYLSLSNQFIRVMPNMPAMINEGMTCLIANKNVTKKNKSIINSLFLNVGKTFWLKKENEIDKVTAISGSGPGYIFFLIDAFEKAAYKLGLDKKATKELVHQTFLGSIKLLLSENKSALILANNIAVKGGTTEAGLNKLKYKKILHKSFDQAVMEAYKKAQQLGDK